MTKQEQLDAITSYIEYAGLTFVEPFSLISSTVVEASYHTGIPKNIILMHINRTFRKKYGEQYIKSQKIVHEVACGKEPNVEKIMATDLKPKEKKERKESERKATTEFGKAFKEYTGLTSKANRPLYNACTNYFYYHKELPWKNKTKWKRICEKHEFVDNNIGE